MHVTLMALAVSDANWTPSVGLVMLLSNLFAIAIGRYAIQKKGVGPKLPLPLPAILDNFGLPELLATTSFGHIIGAGIILGLRATNTF